MQFNDGHNTLLIHFFKGRQNNSCIHLWLHHDAVIYCLPLNIHFKKSRFGRIKLQHFRSERIGPIYIPMWDASWDCETVMQISTQMWHCCFWCVCSSRVFVKHRSLPLLHVSGHLVCMRFPFCEWHRMMFGRWRGDRMKIK